ncbi:MAG: chloramphenicol acetyltransferase, partial [Alistipes sp.]|nr:chloramphenicol acetyltransferase [Alistipes sp.]
MIEVNPNDTTRAAAFEMWMKAPMPMVTIFKKIDIKPIVKISHRNGMKLNALMCYIVAKAASQIDEFFLLPVDGKLMRYDSLAVSVVVDVGDGDISTCDVPYSVD